jgi:hypothetical protein
MAERRLHPAPPDYGLVEVRDDGGRVRFRVYHQGAHICSCASIAQALEAIERHRQRPPAAGEEPQPLPAGYH